MKQTCGCLRHAGIGYTHIYVYVLIIYLNCIYEHRIVLSLKVHKTVDTHL